MLENELIKLRAPEPEDLKVLYEWENDTELWIYGSTIAPFSKYILKKYIATYNTDIFETNQLRFIIESKQDGNVVGIIDLFDFDPFNNRAAVGILVDRNMQNKGIASMALSLLCEYSFKFLHIHMLYAHIPAENKGSIKLFERQGFECAGDLKGWLRVADVYTDVFIYQRIRQ